MIPYGKQNLTEEDIRAVVDTLRSDFLTQGPKVPQLESALANYCHAKHAVAVTNATAALHLACLAAGIGPGDALWTSPNTFVASANCALYCGASVDFVDIDPNTYNLCPESLREKLKRTLAAGKKPPKILVAVHFAGQSCAMKEIAALAKEYNFVVIEDASHAVGGRYLNSPVGSCQYSDMTIFSFHPVKIITTGEGGAILTNNRDLYDKICLLRSHGITRDPAQMAAASHGPWYYEQLLLGYNFRMTDILASLGTSQLQRIDSMIKRRHELAEYYDLALSDLPVIRPKQSPDAYSAYHLYVIQVLKEKNNPVRREVFERLRAKGIGVNVHYIPVHLQPYYQKLGFKHGDFPRAELYYERAITLPLYFDLSKEEQEKVINSLKESLVN